jgi:hypothetical protein
MLRDRYFGSHEFQPREEVIKTSSNRSFGLVCAAFFALIAALGLWLNWGWTKFGLLLHRIVSPVILAFLFYGCIAPIGFLMRLSGKDPLRRRYEPYAASYWIKRTPPGPQPETFKDQF